MKLSFSDTIKTHLALTVVAFIYGLNYTIAKDVMVGEYLTSNGFIMLRVVAGLLIFTIYQSTMIRERLDRRDLAYVALCAVFGVAVNMLCFFAGLKHTSPIHASLIMVLTPCLILVISAVLIKERVTITKIIGISLGLVGAVLLVKGGDAASDKVATVYGDLLVMVNATSYALYLVLVRRLYQKYHPLTVLKWIFFFGMFLVMPFGLSDAVNASYMTWPAHIWWKVAYVLILATSGAYLLNAYALSKTMPSTVGFYVYFQPLIAAGAAIYLGSDTLDLTKILSALLLFGGVYFVNRRPKTSNFTDTSRN